MPNKYLIGIDPGRNTGICVYDPSREGSHKIIALETKDFWGTIEYLENIQNILSPTFFAGVGPEVNYEVIIEDPQLNCPLYFGKMQVKGEAVRLSMAQKVGRNKEQAFILMQYMDRKKIPYRQRKPVNRKHGGGKWDAKTFVYYTKYPGPTNEHERDACKLVWGL